MSFDEVFNSLKKAAKEDPHATTHKAGDLSIPSEVPFGVLTGIPRLDLAMERPGMPAGRVIENFGFEMSGKTTSAYHALAQAQIAGGGGLFIDGEQSWDEDRAVEIGVDPYTNFAISPVDTIEAVFRQMDAAIQGVMTSGFDKPFVIVVDSITGVTSELEKGKEFGAVARVGEDARVIRGGMRKIMPDIAKSNVCVIFINHAVAKIGANKFAKQSDSSGGHAIKFFASLRCNYANAGNIMSSDKERRLGQKINIKVEKLKKSRLERPLVKEAALMGSNGFDLTTELFLAGVESGMIGRPNQKTYSLNDREFSKVDWPEMVKDMGGAQKVYESFIQWALQNGKMKAWDEHYG